MACSNIVGPFDSDHRRVLLENYDAAKKAATDHLIGFVKQIASGFYDEQTNKPLREILIERKHKLQTVLDLLCGRPFVTTIPGPRGGFVGQRTTLVPRGNFDFIRPETYLELQDLVEKYGLEDFQGWADVDWTPARDFAGEAALIVTEVASSEPRDPEFVQRRGRVFIKDYVEAIGGKVHDLVSKFSLTEVLDDADRLSVSDVFRLLMGFRVQDSYAEHELDANELCAVQADMADNLRLVFVVCGWADSQLAWSKF